MAEENKTKGSAAKVNYFIALLGIMAPACYLIGLSYYQGTLSAYGLSPDSFPISSQDTYVTAYYAIGYFLLAITKLVMALLKALFTPPGVFWLIAVSLLVVMTFYVLIKRPALPRNRFLDGIVFQTKKVLKYLHWENNDFTKALGVTGLASYGILSVLYVLMVLSIFWFALPLAAYYKGQSLASEKIDEYLKEGCVTKENEIWSNCKSLKSSNNEDIYTGILIAHTNDIVAFFTEKGSFVFKMPDGGVIVNELAKEKHNRDRELLNK